MLLAGIKEDVVKFADVISKTLDVDVLIVDSSLKTVGNTFRYFDKYDFVKQVSIIGQVITTGEVVAVDDKQNFSVCKACVDFASCEMTGFIGVPIIYNDCVVGAISLVLPKQKIHQIFKDIRNSIAFLQSMSDLLASKLKNRDDYTALNIIRQEREVLMDAVADAVVSTDEAGCISYFNKEFASCFGVSKSVKGRLITDIIPHKIVDSFLETRNTIKDKLISFDSGSCSFYGLVSCNIITISGRHTGMLFTFKSASRTNVEFAEIADLAVKVEFSRYENTIFSKCVVDAAKRLAVTDKVVLIKCAPSTGDELMASCIHNYSDRAKSAFLAVDCAMAYDLQEDVIFGELGRLHMADKGSLFLRNIEYLSIPLQRKLAKFLQSCHIIHDGLMIKVASRLIFSSTADLKGLTDAGMFSDELYYRIAENVLTLEPLCHDKSTLKRVIRENIAFYKSQCGKSSLIFDDNVLFNLYGHHWPRNLEQIAAVTGTLVSECNDRVSLKNLATYAPEICEKPEGKSIAEIERERLVELIASGCRKDEIARALGVSRATLYRKIKLYSL